MATERIPVKAKRRTAKDGACTSAPACTVFAAFALAFAMATIATLAAFELAAVAEAAVTGVGDRAAVENTVAATANACVAETASDSTTLNLHLRWLRLRLLLHSRWLLLLKLL